MLRVKNQWNVVKFVSFWVALKSLKFVIFPYQ